MASLLGNIRVRRVSAGKTLFGMHTAFAELRGAEPIVLFPFPKGESDEAS